MPGIRKGLIAQMKHLLRRLQRRKAGPNTHAAEVRLLRQRLANKLTDAEIAEAEKAI